MTIKKSIGRYNVRKTLRFEMKPIGRTADFLDGHLADDEERAASLNTVKAAIEAEHLTMVRRVFKKLPDPIPSNYAVIRAAFFADPEFAALSNRNANAVLQSILQRCRYNGWAIPKELSDHDGWPTLSVKWHWHCFSKYDPASSDSPVRKWVGRAKSEIETSCPLFRNPKRRRPSRNYWFDHSPFRVMFGNRSVGMSWCADDFNLSRTFLLADGERIIIAIVPRESKFSPVALPEASDTEPSYSLYEETAGLAPKMRPVPKDLIDAPASRGHIYLFELTGRALRSRTNLNALYLRALLSPANLADPVFHLNRACEFFVRKGTDLKRDGKPEHFRQRFTEDKFFVSLRIVVNSQMVATGQRPVAYGDLARFIADHPAAKFITVPAAPSPRGAGKPSLLAGELAKRVIDEDAYVIFDPTVPKSTLSAVERKFNYIVIRGRDPLADGGVLRGYQIPDRLFVGDLDEARKLAQTNRDLYEKKRLEKEAEERLLVERRARKAANRAHAADELRAAQERRRKMEEIVNASKPVALVDPVFTVGKYSFTFKYKTSDNVTHEDTCRADERDEVFQKLRLVRIRPSKVWCDDPTYEADHARAIQSPIPNPQSPIATRLKQLDALKSQGLITEAEYAAQRTKIISEI